VIKISNGEDEKEKRRSKSTIARMKKRSIIKNLN
jgi:hypothetical protein